MFEVIFFKTAAGNEPVRAWLRDLKAEERVVIGADLRTVQLGFPLGMPLCRPLGNGLYEVRSSLPTKKEARVIFFHDAETLVIVNGFIKKTQKISDAEIDTARRRKAEYDGHNKNVKKQT